MVVLVEEVGRVAEEAGRWSRAGDAVGEGISTGEAASHTATGQIETHNTNIARGIVLADTAVGDEEGAAGRTDSGCAVPTGTPSEVKPSIAG